jgi:uncharacterized protein YkwD
MRELRAFVWIMVLSLAQACAARDGEGLFKTARADGRAPSAAAYDSAPRGAPVLGDAASPSLARAIAEGCRQQGLIPDGRLAEVALLVSRLAPDAPPSAADVRDAARRAGLFEPTPIVWQASASRPEDLLAPLEEAVAQARSDTRITHCGAAFSARQDRVSAALVLSGRFLELQRPIPRRLDQGETLLIRARLAQGYSQPALAVTDPKGQTERVALADRRRIDHRMLVSERGRYTVEVLAEGPEGSAVLAIMPVVAGEALPPAPPSASRDPGERNADEVRQKLAALIAAERKSHQLNPLQLDPRLSAVAASHSLDMVEHHFVAHTSKNSGTAIERVSRAGLRPAILLENIGRGYGAQEIHHGLMDSPGHRANLLNPDVTALGIGAVAEAEGDRSAFVVTELFARLATHFSREDAEAAIGALRSSAKVAPAPPRRSLSQAAERAAQQYARAPQPVSERWTNDLLLAATQRVAVPKGATRLAASLLLATDVRQLSELPQLAARNLLAFGVATAPLPTSSSQTTVVVLLLAIK